MPSSLKTYDPDGSEDLTQEERAILELALGKRICNDSHADRTVDLLATSIFGTLLFIILTHRQVDNWLSQFIPDYYYRLIAKALIFFVFLYLFDRWVNNWRSQHNFCK